MAFMSTVEKIIKYTLWEHYPGSVQNGRTSSEMDDHIYSKMLFSGSPGPVLQRTSTRTTGRHRISSAPGLKFLVLLVVANQATSCSLIISSRSDQISSCLIFSSRSEHINQFSVSGLIYLVLLLNKLNKLLKSFILSSLFQHLSPTIEKNVQNRPY